MSVPSWPSKRVVAVARIPLEHVVAGPEQRGVVAVVAEDEIVAVAAEKSVGALAAEDGVVSRTAVDGELHDAGRQRGGGDAVVSSQRVDDQAIVGPFAVRDVDACRKSEDRDRTSRPQHVDDVVAVRAVDGDGVRRGVAGCAADRPGEIDVDFASRRSPQVVDGHRVDAAERIDVEGLDVVDVHDDVAEIAGEQRAPAVGRECEISSPALPLNSSVSVPSWPSTRRCRRPDPTGIRRCRRRGRRCRCPAGLDESLPSPPRRTSTPLLPRMVSLPVPPSTVTPMRAARLPVALKLSSPPFMLRTSFSVVPMSMLNGAGSSRSKRTRVPLAVAVKTSAPLPPLTSAVRCRRRPRSGRCRRPGSRSCGRRRPRRTSGRRRPAGQRVVAGAAEQHVEATLAEQYVVATFSEDLILARTAGDRVVAVAAARSRRQGPTGFVERDRVVIALAETRIRPYWRRSVPPWSPAPRRR